MAPRRMSQSERQRMLQDDRQYLELENLQIRSLERELAELDVLMSTNESFAKRIGLLPFAAGAVPAAAALAVIQLITHL
ncbi:Uncharacterised protein [Paucimonas lemoignei]|nr:Uncharacterised protein [Paucimonas lemoignei]